MALHTFLLPFIFSLLILLIIYFDVANGVQINGDNTILQLRKEIGHVPKSSFFKSRRENGASILEMRHKDFSFAPNSDLKTKLQNRLISDNNRVHSLQTKIKNQNLSRNKAFSQSQIPMSSGIKLQTLNYIVTIQLGGKNMTVIVDTGSDLTWVQCQPCKLCYNQQDPLFNPSLSPSYKYVPCKSQPCESLQSATGNSGICEYNNMSMQICNYYVSYGDGSFTRGDLALENLKIANMDFDSFLFGCGRNNKGLFGGTSGIMGLGRSELSLISQTSSIFRGIFSYCLPSSDCDDLGSLTLGNDFSGYRNLTPISYTNLVQNLQLSSFYLLNLTGISIGGVDLVTPSFNTGDILIDSGTVITRLQPSIYKALKTEFTKQFSGFPAAPGFSILDTCYNLSSYNEVNVPTIRLNFEGSAQLNVDVTGVFYFVE